MDRRGCQEPTFRLTEKYDKTAGSQAIVLADAYGLPPHEWQRGILEDWLAVDSNGVYVNNYCILAVQRQNGKTGVSDPRETYGLIVRGEQILHTAHEFQTAQKAFDRLRKKFGTRVNDPTAQYPELNAMVRKYTTSANQMVLDLKNGGHIEFRTRGSGGDMGRGGTFDLVVIDEAQCYTDEQDAALSPLNSAAPSGSPQTILMGTVPDPRFPHKGEKFATMREKMHKSPERGFCIHEWATDEIGDVYDRDRWYRFNPSLGYQLLESALAKDAATMSADTFAREHLGFWPELIELNRVVIREAAWDALSTETPPADGKRAYGVRFSPDGSEAFLAAALLADDGTVHTEMVRRESMSNGTSWLAEFIAERVGEASVCVIDGKSGVQGLVDRLGRMPKGYVHVCSASDATSAAATLADCVNEKTLTWYAPQADLRDSAVKSIRRSIGNGGSWGFGGENPEPITAAALAVWGVKTARRDPRRKGLVG